LDGDDLWLGVKGYSNLEIAGFPRNKFKFGVQFNDNRGRALHRYTKCTSENSEYYLSIIMSN